MNPGDLFIRRTWWTADLARDGAAAWLLPRPGARRIALWRADLSEVTNKHEAHATLDATVGDRFVACGPELDEIAVLVVEAVDRVERLRIAVAAGEIAPETRTVQITELSIGPRRARRSA